ncbi:hypothetical protein DFJ73DRAFT_564962 [Zopfochytrium polystomum]|nr:hypothetical protein DFJ73DRAFT_564962 [Zopfochytrium polystomum]
MATTYYGCFQSTLGGVRGAIGNVVAYSNVKTLADCKSSCAAASEGSAANTYNYARSYGTTSSAAGRMLCSCFKASSLPNLSADSCSGCTYLIGSSPTEFTASDFASSQCGNYNANVTSTGERYTFAIYTVDTTTTTSWSSSSSSSSSTTWNPSTSTTSSTPSSSDSPTTSSPSGTGTSSGITTGTGGSTTSGSTSTSPTSTGSGAGSGNDGKGSGNPSDQSSSSSSGISTGAIGGIVGGIGLLLIAVAAVYFFVLRPKWNQQRQADKKELMSSIFVNSGSGGSGGRGPGSGGSPQTSNSPPNQWSSPNSSEYQPGHGSNQPSSNPSQRWSNPTGEWQPQSGYGAGQPGVPNGGQMAPQPGFGAGQPGAPERRPDSAPTGLRRWSAWWRSDFISTFSLWGRNSRPVDGRMGSRARQSDSTDSLQCTSDSKPAVGGDVFTSPHQPEHGELPTRRSAAAIPGGTRCATGRRLSGVPS